MNEKNLPDDISSKSLNELTELANKIIKLVISQIKRFISIEKKLFSNLFIPRKTNGIFSIKEYKPVPVCILTGRLSKYLPCITSRKSKVRLGLFI